MSMEQVNSWMTQNQARLLVPNQNFQENSSEG